MDMTVEEGEDLEICCTDDNPSGLGVTQRWQRLDGTLMTSDAVFTVENASRSHAGIYQCVLTNGMNETLVANATVVIQCKFHHAVSIHNPELTMQIYAHKVNNQLRNI